MGRLVDRLEEGGVVLVLAVMTVVAFVNVVTRYLVQYSLAFTEEIVVSLFVWLTLLGTAVGFREGAHLAFSYLIERAPRPLRRLALAASTLLSVALFALLLWFGLGQVQNERLLGTTSEALAVPQWWYTAGIPVVSALIIVRILQAARRAARQLDR